MPESKFSGIFQKAKISPADSVHAPEEPQRREKPVRSVGRPLGKRSDPTWKQFSVLLKKETHRQAANILRAKDDGLDLSGLIQNLLEVWIKKQNP